MSRRAAPRGRPAERAAQAALDGHAPRRRFGQHFLADRAIVEAIVEAIAPRPGERIVEIGPGLGALTLALLARHPSLLAIELDRDLAARLRARPEAAQITLVQADALDVDYRALAAGARLRLVGNLPYNISTPLLVRLIAFRDVVEDQHFMLQDEVVERIVAGPRTSQYGRLGVLLQACYDCEKVLEVPPQAFVPPPRVDSAVVRMTPLRSPRVHDIAALQALLAAAFAQRRKMLRATLIPWLAARGVPADGLTPTDRPEDVAQATYYALADACAAASAPAGA